MNLCCEVFFVNFWVIFGYIWEEIRFLEGLVKLREIKKYWRFSEVLKLEFVVHN